MPLRAVFFDAGETILHPAPSFPELFAKVLNEAGHDIDHAAVREGLAVIPKRFVEAAERAELWTTSPERSRAFWTSLYGRFLERAGLPTDDGLKDALYRAFTDIGNYELFEDVRPALRTIREAGLHLGLISNFEAWLEELLVTLRVRDTFSTVVISGVEGIEKPDPAIFRLGLERAGVRPQAAIYVGDVPAFDVDAPRSVGMDAVLIDRRERYPSFDGPRITTLGDLPALLGIDG